FAHIELLRKHLHSVRLVRLVPPIMLRFSVRSQERVLARRFELSFSQAHKKIVNFTKRSRVAKSTFPLFRLIMPRNAHAMT
ncbi:hypothetical protein, partial [Paraburkholderia sp. SIMBA_054]|uniref:hypothetical protein n=1 Tax=Paraburkholderia sp. SIMBA_054 TaxID=3085795 RepID=UPI00397C9065